MSFVLEIYGPKSRENVTHFLAAGSKLTTDRSQALTFESATSAQVAGGDEVRAGRAHDFSVEPA